MFIHLKVHTSYSLLESSLQIGAIAKMVEADSMPAVGITDSSNMFGALEASDKLAVAGIQPIIGVTIQLEWGFGGEGPLTLLAMNEAGYQSLCKIVSAAHLRPAGGHGPSVAMSTLSDHQTGLLALSGGIGGPVDGQLAQGRHGLARERLLQLQKIFHNRLYVEIQRHDGPADTERDLIGLAYGLGLPIVGTHDCLFAGPDDYEAHDVLLAISEGKRASEDDRRRVSREQWLKPQRLMKVLFSDLPEAIENTVEIAKRCSFRPLSRKPLLPHFADDEQDELRRQAEAGLDDRLAIGGLAAGRREADYRARLAYECGVISKMGFAGYFLIVADFIKWAKSNSIAVGPGRGSGAGSVVAWALTITDLDPLRFGLLFERFLNPDRVSMPDFDIDFCQERREEVIRYVQGKYGHDRVAQIITHGKLQARAVVRDVGRALSMPNGYIDKLAKMIPNNPAAPVTLAEAIAMEPQLADARRDQAADRLFEIALRLEGLYRNASTHAAGVVIGDRPLDELLPLYSDGKGEMPVTQFNWKLCEAAGLVKFDFLGLKTLTVIQRTLAHIKHTRGVVVDLSRLPLDDSHTLELFCNAFTVGVFQLESAGMRESLRELKPDRFEDIIAMVALYRPGPMANIPSYVARKHGKEPIDYPHEMLIGILEETYGVIIYQEQVIQIAQVMGGYTLGQADLLRRAMGKKDKKEMARERSRFVRGAIKRGLTAEHAGEIFDLIDKFAGYGFNKSHAAAYALIGYQTAYLKAHYCEEFLAASMSLDMDDTDRLSQLAQEARSCGVSVLPPDINDAGVEFLPVHGSRSAVRFALTGIKHVGASSAAAIVAERKNGKFASITDMARRLDSKAIGGKRGIEMLASAGAFDSIDSNRRRIHEAASDIIAFAKVEAEDKAKGIADLFGSVSDHGSRSVVLADTPDWPDTYRCHEEYGSVGFYLSGHPLDAHRQALARRGIISRRQAEGVRGRVKLAAICLGMKKRISKNGNPFAWLTLSDESGNYEAIAFSDFLDGYGDRVTPGAMLLVTAKCGDKFMVESVELFSGGDQHVR
jgi:DNA polymerase-3 subunit alpha